MRNKRKKNKRGFTDTLYRYNFIFVVTVVALSVLTVWATVLLQAYLIYKGYEITIPIDYTIFCTIVPSAFAELGIHTGFIVWKAKCENLNKYSSDFVENEKAKLDMEEE